MNEKGKGIGKPRSFYILDPSPSFALFSVEVLVEKFDRCALGLDLWKLV